MTGSRWQPEGIAQIAATYRVVGLRHRAIKVPTKDLVTLCDKIAEVMREANGLADENEALKAELEKANRPKFAPFAPARRAQQTLKNG